MIAVFLGKNLVSGRVAPDVTTPSRWGPGGLANLGYSQWVALTAFLVIAASMARAYVPLRADDAYIVGRYANNFVAGLGIVFNQGERINALTSPLHFFLLVLLHPFSGDVVHFYQIVGSTALGAVVVWVAIRQWALTWRAILFLALVLISPFLMFWSVGGLETPILTALMLLISHLAMRPSLDLGSTRPCALIVLSTLAVLTRYDAVLLVTPVTLLTLYRRRSDRSVLVTFAACTLLFAGWLVFTYEYFGDLLPTSFYVKAGHLPTYDEAVRGIVYLGSFIIISLVWFPLLLGTKSSVTGRQVTYGRALVCGLIVAGAYGVFAGTKHMMYAYRFYVPFLPVLALVAVDAVQPALLRRVAPITMLITLLQLSLGFVLYYKSENPSLALLWEHGNEMRESFEFAHMGARHTDQFLEQVAAQAEVISRHWPQQEAAQGRPPRVSAATGGLLPYLLPSSYVFETLVSYRHVCRPDTEPLADYVQVIYRGESASDAARERERSGRDLIARTSFMAEGLLDRPVEVVLEIWYRVATSQINLPDRIAGPCE
jgi:hypothetical protein